MRNRRHTHTERLVSWKLPSESWALLVGVPIDPLIVQKSVGENSGSLIGPLGANGVKIVDGDWSMPRLWRYSCKKNKQRHVQSDLKHHPASSDSAFTLPGFVLQC